MGICLSDCNFIIFKKKGLINKINKLSDRVYKCECGYVEDRDYNASLNLRDAKIYKIA